MSKGKIIFAVLLLMIIAALAYVKHTKNKEVAAKATPQGKGGPQTLMAAGFVAEFSKLSNDLSANGNILAQDEVQLQPEVSGRVTYLNIKEGAVVSKGTLLMKINDADLRAQVAKSNAQLKIALANLKRVDQLLKINGVSQAEYDAAENAVNNINADIELLKHELSNMDVPRNENRIDINLLENLNETNYQKIKAALEQYKKAKINSYNKTNAEKDKTVSHLINTGGADALKKLKDDNTNESLDNIVLNKTDFTILTEAENSLVQRYQPVYMNGEKNSFLRAPLYVSQKNVFGNYHSTFAVNLAVIWLMTLSLVVALYFDWLNKALKFFERLFERKRE